MDKVTLAMVHWLPDATLHVHVGLVKKHDPSSDSSDKLAEAKDPIFTEDNDDNSSFNSAPDDVSENENTETWME